jgi:low temperature requirement protein LtrA
MSAREAPAPAEPTDRAASRGAAADDREQRVTPLELFFDLVFVLALTQVTAFLADHSGWLGMLQGAALLAVLWWAWATYSWLTNAVSTEEAIPARLVVLAAMAAMLVCALAVPDAFGRNALPFALAYAVVRALQVALFLTAGGDNAPAAQRAILRLAPGYLGAPALLIGAALVDGPPRAALWVAAFALDIGIAYVGGVAGFRVHAAHFAERHGLIVIIALGESIVALGVGAEGLPLERGLAAGAGLGVALAAGLWWAYFDIVTLYAERDLAAATGEARARLARDAYSGLHLPLVAGIIFAAYGLKVVLAHVADPLGLRAAVALCGGVALFLLAHNAIRLRLAGSVSVPRLVVAAAAIALIPVAVRVDALATLAILVALVAGLGVVETIHAGADRRAMRGRHPAGVHPAA